MGTDFWPGRVVTEIGHGRVGVVRLEGEHDLAIVPSLEAVITTLLNQGYPLVIDLSEAEFVDAPVLGVLKRAQEAARTHDVGFALCLPPTAKRSISRILNLTGVATLMPVAESREQALEMAEDAAGEA